MKLQGLVAGGEVFAMDSVSSRPGRAGAQSCGDQRSQPRRSGTQSCGVQQPQVKFDYGEQPRCSGGDNQQSQVRYDYGKQPRCNGGGNLQRQGEDGLLQDARKLCALFKKQELVTN